jgi:hypothetical protein
LIQREAGAEAGAISAAEGEPFVAGEAAFEEALGAEGERIGIKIFAAVDEVIARAERDAGGIFASAGDERLFGDAHDEREDRAQAQRFAEGCVEVRQGVELIGARRRAAGGAL